MIRTCKNCGGRVAFDVQKKGLSCVSCGSLFDVSDFDAKPEDYNEAAPEPVDDSNMINCSIYQCSACGAEISITNTEVSTFCIYCGNPTIVFSRVSKMRKPDTILPFKITKKQAVELVRDKIQSGFFIPKSIKNYEIEQMRGIYIPYHITNVEYDASMICSSVHSNGKRSTTRYYKRSAYASMPWVTTDASTTLADSTSQRLEPYHLESCVPFDEDYLVGFYSDMSDVEEKDAISLAKKRARQVFEAEIMNSFSGSSKKIVNQRCRAEVYDKPITAMLPAWFITFRYQDQPYTIIVNGQTGKVIGGVPWDKALFTGVFVGIAVFLSIIFVILINFMAPGLFGSSHGRHSSSNDGTGKIIGFLIMCAIGSISAGVSKIKKVLKSIERTSASTLTTYVSKRQKGG